MIYLDHAATTPVLPQVAAAMAPYVSQTFGNAHSVHQAGKQAEQALEQARQTIATILGAQQPEDVIFTSSATEANNLAIQGLVRYAHQQHPGQLPHIITSSIEHDAVLNVCKALEQQHLARVTYLPVDTLGLVSTEQLQAAMTPQTILVSIMHANNEVGTLQPIQDLAVIAHQHGALFHTDAVQTVGKLPIEMAAWGVDLLSAAGHKCYAPKGIGVLIANKQARQVMAPLMYGGTHESGLRPSTHNVAGAVGFAAALQLLQQHQIEHQNSVLALQQQLVQGIKALTPVAVFNGPVGDLTHVPGIINVSFPPAEGEALVLRMDLKGICVSSGSACHGSQLQGSHVVLAMGQSKSVATATLRFSLGFQNTTQDITDTLMALADVLKRFKIPVTDTKGSMELSC